MDTATMPQRYDAEPTPDAIPSRMLDIFYDSAEALLMTSRVEPFIVMRSNASLQQLLGYSEGDILHYSVYLLHGPETCTATASALADALKNSQVVTVRLLGYTKTKQKVLLTIKVSPMYDCAGRLAFFLHNIQSARDNESQGLVSLGVPDVKGKVGSKRPASCMRPKDDVRLAHVVNSQTSSFQPPKRQARTEEGSGGSGGSDASEDTEEYNQAAGDGQMPIISPMEEAPQAATGNEDDVIQQIPRTLNWCHACKVKKTVVQCSNKQSPSCKRRFCQTCLRNHNLDMNTIIASGYFVCLVCKRTCICAACKRKTPSNNSNIWKHLNLMPDSQEGGAQAANDPNCSSSSACFPTKALTAEVVTPSGGPCEHETVIPDCTLPVVGATQMAMPPMWTEQVPGLQSMVPNPITPIPDQSVLLHQLAILQQQQQPIQSAASNMMMAGSGLVVPTPQQQFACMGADVGGQQLNTCSCPITMPGGGQQGWTMPAESLVQNLITGKQSEMLAQHAFLQQVLGKQHMSQIGLSQEELMHMLQHDTQTPQMYAHQQQ